MLKFILGDSSPVDVNSRKCIGAAILMGVVGPEVFIVQPGFVQGLIEFLGFDERTANFAASREMFGIAATTILMTFIAHRVNWRQVFFWSLLTIFVANALCTFVTDPETFVILRVVAGLGSGGLVSLSFAAIGLTNNPDRNFGWMIMWVLIYGAIALLLMPTAYELAGMNGVLWFFALFPIVALPFVRWLPVNGEEHVQVEEDAVNLATPLKGMALFAMLFYFMAQGLVWANLFLIGLDGGLSDQEVANGLGISQFAGIGGALLAAMLAHNYGRALPLAAGILGGASCLYWLVGEFSFFQYATAVVIYNFLWNLTHPFLLAAMASFDRTGRVVVYAVAMQMIGIAFGPDIAGRVISEGDFINVNRVGAGLFVLSFVLIVGPVLRQARLHREQAGAGQVA